MFKIEMAAPSLFSYKPKPWYRFLTAFVVSVVFVGFLAGTACAETFRAGLLIPKAKGRAAQHLAEVEKGVLEARGIKVVRRVFDRSASTKDVVRWVKRKKIKVLIALGQKGYKLVHTIKLDIPVVVGALLISPNGVSGVSLAGDPEQFLSSLNKLAPSVKRVHWVYSEEGSGWLMPFAKKTARKYGLTLLSHRARSKKEAVAIYTEILGDVRFGVDGVWLPWDQGVPAKTLVPLILKEAWTKKLVVFSYKLSHTRKGMLFSLVPDFAGHGHRLADLALEMVKNKSKHTKVVPTRSMKLAVNVRTASHLKLLLSTEMRGSIDLVYPRSSSP